MTDSGASEGTVTEQTVTEGIVTEPFEELVERLTEEADEGFFHTAAQIVVVADGECVLDTAVGTTHLEQPFTRDTLSALYCTAKPLVAAMESRAARRQFRAWTRAEPMRSSQAWAARW